VIFTLLNVSKAAVAATRAGSAFSRLFSHSFCLRYTSLWIVATY